MSRVKTVCVSLALSSLISLSMSASKPTRVRVDEGDLDGVVVEVEVEDDVLALDGRGPSKVLVGHSFTEGRSSSEGSTVEEGPVRVRESAKQRRCFLAGGEDAARDEDKRRRFAAEASRGAAFEDARREDAPDDLGA